MELPPPPQPPHVMEHALQQQQQQQQQQRFKQARKAAASRKKEKPPPGAAPPPPPPPPPPTTITTSAAAAAVAAVEGECQTKKRFRSVGGPLKLAAVPPSQAKQSRDAAGECIGEQVMGGVHGQPFERVQMAKMPMGQFVMATGPNGHKPSILRRPMGPAGGTGSGQFVAVQRRIQRTAPILIPFPPPPPQQQAQAQAQTQPAQQAAVGDCALPIQISIPEITDDVSRIAAASDVPPLRCSYSGITLNQRAVVGNLCRCFFSMFRPAGEAARCPLLLQLNHTKAICIEIQQRAFHEFLAMLIPQLLEARSLPFTLEVKDLPHAWAACQKVFDVRHEEVPHWALRVCDSFRNRPNPTAADVLAEPISIFMSLQRGLLVFRAVASKEQTQAPPAAATSMKAAQTEAASEEPAKPPSTWETSSDKLSHQLEAFSASHLRIMRDFEKVHVQQMETLTPVANIFLSVCEQLDRVAGSLNSHVAPPPPPPLGDKARTREVGLQTDELLVRDRELRAHHVHLLQKFVNAMTAAFQKVITCSLTSVSGMEIKCLRLHVHHVPPPARLRVCDEPSVKEELLEMEEFSFFRPGASTPQIRMRPPDAGERKRKEAPRRAAPAPASDAHFSRDVQLSLKTVKTERKDKQEKPEKAARRGAVPKVKEERLSPPTARRRRVLNAENEMPQRPPPPKEPTTRVYQTRRPINVRNHPNASTQRAAKPDRRSSRSSMDMFADSKLGVFKNLPETEGHYLKLKQLVVDFDKTLHDISNSDLSIVPDVMIADAIVKDTIKFSDDQLIHYIGQNFDFSLKNVENLLPMEDIQDACFVPENHINRNKISDRD